MREREGERGRKSEREWGGREEETQHAKHRAADAVLPLAVQANRFNNS